MNTRSIYIKNMVCNRCIMVVESVFRNVGIEPLSVQLGEVLVDNDLYQSKQDEVKAQLETVGFKLIDDKKGRLIEQIKTLIIDLVHNNDNDLKINLSDYIADTIPHEYNYLSNLFSEVVGTTIEKYFIAQKIEKVKELLIYDELTLSEIAFKLNYSSTAHLSAQFKKVTGLTPSFFKQIREQKRKPLDEV